jgi:hypothetical protein
MSFDAGAAGVNLTVDAKNVIADSSGLEVRSTQAAGASATITLQNSNYSTTEGSGTITDLGGHESAAPQFVDAAGGDFRQLAASPTIDAGVTDPLLGTLDIHGDARIRDAAPDIGAYEYRVNTPEIVGVHPLSGSNNNNPSVYGVGGPNVSIFTTDDCSGTAAGTGAFSDFLTPGIAVTVADNSTTTFRAQADDGLGRTSDCSSTSVTYTEVTPAGAFPTPPRGTPVPKPKPAVKNCKKPKKKTPAAKKKFKKCKKRLRAAK